MFPHLFPIVRRLVLLGFVLSLNAWIAPAHAGSGGMAGSAAFSIDSNGNVTGVAAAAAIGANGAAAWAFNDGIANSAGAMGSSGVMTLINFTSNQLESIHDSVPGTYETQMNELGGGFDVQLGTTGGEVILQAN